MPRKSAAELATAAAVDIGALPEPPADFDEQEAALWHSIVATKPADWWDAANLPMLRALVKHETAARLIDEEMGRFEPKWLRSDEGVGRYKALTSMRVQHTQRVESLMTKMRLTQQSRYDVQKAARKDGKVKKDAGGSRPWAA